MVNEVHVDFVVYEVNMEDLKSKLAEMNTHIASLLERL
jgi:hypothetical protein